jgi:hypothetical protein
MFVCRTGLDYSDIKTGIRGPSYIYDGKTPQKFREETSQRSESLFKN